MKVTHKIYLLGYALLTLLMLGSSKVVEAQFYNGSQLTFGKNRVQYKDFLWTYYNFEKFDTYFYRNGQELAQLTARYAQDQINEIEMKLESTIDDKIQFIVFNNLSDLKQSNIGSVLAMRFGRCRAGSLKHRNQNESVSLKRSMMISVNR